MFKKIVAMALCALMLGGAMGETGAQAWHVTVDGIEVSYGGETVALNPTVEAVIGRENADCWSEIAILLNGEAALVAQGEYVGDTLTASVDGANDVLFIDGAEMFLSQFNIPVDKLQRYIAALFALLSENALPQMDNLKIEFTGKNEAAAEASLNGWTLRAHIVWNEWSGDAPYDLTAKNICRYTFREMFPGDGTDIPETVQAALETLLADESVQALKALIPVSAPVSM